MVWPAAGAAKPLDAVAVAREHCKEPLDDRCCRFSNTPWATHKILAAALVAWPAAEAAKPLDAAAAAQGRVDLPVHPCRLPAGLQAVCAPSASFRSYRLPRRANGRGERRSPSAFGRSARPRPQTDPPKPAPRFR